MRKVYMKPSLFKASVTLQAVAAGVSVAPPPP